MKLNHCVLCLADYEPSTSYSYQTRTVTATARLTSGARTHVAKINCARNLARSNARRQATTTRLDKVERQSVPPKLPEDVLDDIRALVAAEEQEEEGNALLEDVKDHLEDADLLNSTHRNTTGQSKRNGRKQRQQEASNGIAVAQQREHRCGYVALIGKPNAGKSTLMNALVGQKLSIVTQKAQTTRHRILGILSDEDSQVILLDTPGVIEAIHNQLDVRMMEAVRESLQDADGVLVVVDSTAGAEEVLPIVRAAPATGPAVAVVLNKMDLVNDKQLQQLTDLFQSASPAVREVFACAALNNKGVDAVQQWVSQIVPPGPALYDKEMVADQPERFFVAEIVREQVFLQYRQEIPYSISVLCTDYKERARNKDYVQVEVYVERAQQRGIVLGREGSALKKLNTAARAEIEAFLGRPVYLDVSVKVREKWRVDDKVLQQFGY